MEIEPACNEVVAWAAARSLRNAPVLAIGFDQVAARGHAGELFEEKTPFAAAAEAKFANQLLVSGFGAGRTCDMRQQFAIGHILRLGQRGGRCRSYVKVRCVSRNWELV